VEPKVGPIRRLKTADMTFMKLTAGCKKLLVQRQNDYAGLLKKK
jgi:hypothetical protein